MSKLSCCQITSGWLEKERQRFSCWKTNKIGLILNINFYLILTNVIIALYYIFYPIFIKFVCNYYFYRQCRDLHYCLTRLVKTSVSCLSGLLSWQTSRQSHKSKTQTPIRTVRLYLISMCKTQPGYY